MAAIISIDSGWSCLANVAFPSTSRRAYRDGAIGGDLPSSIACVCRASKNKRQTTVLASAATRMASRCWQVIRSLEPDSRGRWPRSGRGRMGWLLAVVKHTAVKEEKSRLKLGRPRYSLGKLACSEA